MRRGSIQRRLFIVYAGFLLAIVLAITLIVNMYMTQLLEGNAADMMKQQVQTIGKQMELKATAMNDLSKRLLYSQLLVERFYSPLFGMDNDSLLNRRTVEELVYAIAGTDFQVLQINMIHDNGQVVSMGKLRNAYMQLPGSATACLPWYQDVLEANGRKMFIGPYTDELGGKVRVLSLSRAFSDSFNKPANAVLELQLAYTWLETLAREETDIYRRDGVPIQLAIYDADGNTAYALEDDPGDSVWLPREAALGEAGSLRMMKNAQMETICVVSWAVEEVGWNVALMMPLRDMLSAATAMSKSLFLLGGLAMLAMALICYAISRWLTRPIAQIHRAIEEVTLNTLGDLSKKLPDSRVNELETLNQAFRQMSGTLLDSLDELVLLRSHELQSSMRVLQAQMHPHFLYNMLTTLSVMAEEQYQMEIVQACGDISEMLRYITGGGDAQTTLAQELSHAERYLGLMKLRFLDNLEYEIAVPRAAQNALVPRMVVQPLVENCIKHSDCPLKRCHIEIRGEQCADGWTLTVRDDGKGFSTAVLDELVAYFHRDLKTIDTGLNLKGMGLKNICTRLRLIYSERAVFRVENPPGGGAMVTIGGAYETGEDAGGGSAGHV